MSRPAQRLLVRIGRWPRRIAALVCLVLAAASALTAPEAAPSARPPDRLRRGEVAVPVPIAGGAVAVRPADEVGVLAPPADGDSTGDAVLVADHLRVMSITRSAGLGGDATAVVVVASDRAAALRLARYAARPLLMIVDDLP
jgi:hypothetical protein